MISVRYSYAYAPDHERKSYTIRQTKMNVSKESTRFFLKRVAARLAGESLLIGFGIADEKFWSLRAFLIETVPLTITGY